MMFPRNSLKNVVVSRTLLSRSKNTSSQQQHVMRTFATTSSNTATERLCSTKLLAALTLTVGTFTIASTLPYTESHSSSFATTTTTYCDSLPVYGKPGTNQERTFLAIKPDGVQRGLIGDIIQRFEKRGYKLVGLKMVWPTLEMAQAHYADLKKKPFYPGLCQFFSSGPIVCMCWEGKDVIKQGRQMLGETQPLASKPGSIRGDFSIDLGRNICHGSDSVDSAEHELKMWFPEGVNDWTKTVDSSVYE